LTDEIYCPPKENFKRTKHSSATENFYSTMFHELSHWTGHESRLDRDLTNSFGSVGYAKEELRAEIASFMLSSQIGVDFDPSNHVAYVASWVKILEDTPKEIFKASSDAGKIVQFVAGMQHEQAQTKTQTLSKEAVELGYMYPPKDLEAAQNLTNSLEAVFYEMIVDKLDDCENSIEFRYDAIPPRIAYRLMYSGYIGQLYTSVSNADSSDQYDIIFYKLGVEPTRQLNMVIQHEKVEKFKHFKNIEYIIYTIFVQT